MPRAGVGERAFEFGDWRIEPSRGAMVPLAGGREVRLEPRLMDLLLLFAGSGGRVLSKDDIVQAVWDGRAIGDDTLAATISRLRRALGGTGERRYIETLPKRGYRLLLAATEPAPADAPGPAAPREAPARASALIAQGRAALQAPFAASLAQARLYFEAAVAEAPAYAPGHVGLAEALAAQHLAGEGEGLMAAARGAAQAAVGLDPGLAEAWATLGLAILVAGRDFAGADEALRRAMALDPALGAPHRHRAFAYAAMGRFAEAEREARLGVELESVSLAAHGALLQILIAARRFGAAVAAANAALALAPAASEAWYAKGWAQVLAGETSAGVEALLRGLELWSLDAATVARLRRAYQTQGFAGLCAATAAVFEGQQVLFRPKVTDLAILWTGARQADRAFAALETALRRDDPLLMLLPWLPHFDPLRGDPRFGRLVGRVRLAR
ncbi:MAG TPA: winged helix-turn-helix domain-containing protein [Phenylobacterium sp.]|uniref:winged helix-turn-helix domain-containing protein n=1 Tax=Phenylobacterium sp. TaxID=1871053 RepID=UPI002B942A5B|nr:winged helix-turn-helix domain-containing protein [Phenylobacterium sp.]HSV04296.1 winged helix-turn-helix domain-containing protein [Phenylobacterium sp.]